MKNTVYFARITALLLAMLLLTGCGTSANTASSTETKAEPAVSSAPADPTQPPAAAAEETAAEEEPAPEPKKSYRWDDITFELHEITEDVSSWTGQVSPPEGKYVMVDLAITDGKIGVNRLKDLIMTEQKVRLDDYDPTSIVFQGISIQDNSAYAVGSILVFFDVPTEFDTAAANATIIAEEAYAPDAGTAAAGQQAGTVSLAEGTAFRWRDHDGSVVKTDIGGISSGPFVLKPADMTDDEYCFDLYLNVDDELRENKDLKSAFYAAAILVDAQGNQYSPQVSATPSEGADLLFLYAIPNGVAAEELQLSFTA